MPRSWNESSSVNANRPDASPKRKLSVMNFRSSAVRGSISDLEMVDESIDQNLRRQHADKRHVVFLADGAPLAAFLDEELHCTWVEDAVALHLFAREQVVHVVAGGACEERRDARRPVRLLGSAPHGRWDDGPRERLEEVLLVETAQFEGRRQSRSERHDVRI